MRLTWFIIFVAFNVYKAASGARNDIVGSMRCRLLCKEADGYPSEVKDQNICRCNIAKKLSDKQLLKVQELSTYYNLPVLFEREHHNYKVKRQLDDNLLEGWRAKLDDHWAETADNLKAWREQQARELPILGDIEEHAENLKAWHEQQARENPILGNLGGHAENLKNWQKQLEDNPVLGDIQKQTEDIQAWHQDTMDQWQDNMQDHQEKLREHLEDLKEGLGDVDLENFGSKFEKHAEDIKRQFESLPNVDLPDLDGYKEKVQSFFQQPAEPILGQMAPQLTTYDSKATGIGGSNVDFPKTDSWNPYYPPLAHVLRALPFSFNFGPRPTPADPRLANPARPVFPASPAAPLAPPFPRIFSRSNVGPSLPANYAGPYNPRNPIVVQPVLSPNHDNPTPKPILSALRNSVDDMLANMKKNGGRLIPENYMNSDALSNSESQVNQINVNVRVEPTPTPPNMYSFFLPWQRNWLSAAAPKNVDENGNEVTENPGIIDESDEDANDKKRNDHDEDDDEVVDEERRMQKQLKDADKSRVNAHVVDSVKKNLASKEKEAASDAQYGDGLIVQPKQFIDSEEDLETLVK